MSIKGAFVINSFELKYRDVSKGMCYHYEQELGKNIFL